MENIRNWIGIAVVMLVFMFAVVSQAATDANPIEGRLKAVYSDFITITVFPDTMKSADMNTSNGGELSFKVDSQTAYDNIARLTELKEGDKIRIEYKEDKGRNTAVTITKLDSGPARVETTQQTTTTITTTTVTSPEDRP